MPARIALFLVLSLSLATPARADEEVLLVLVEDPEHRIDAPALERGVVGDLGIPVAEEGQEPSTVVRVRVLEGGRAVIEVEAASASRSRTLDLPEGSEEATRVLVLVAANLARDEASALLDELTRRAEPEAVAEPVAVPRPEAAPSGEDEPAAVSLEVSEEPAIDPWSRPVTEEHPFRFGFVHRLGAIPGPGPLAQPYFSWAFEVGYAIDPAFTIGITDLTFGAGYSSVEGGIWSVGGAIFGELSGFVDSRIQLYGRLGVALQGRSAIAPRSAFQAGVTVGAVGGSSRRGASSSASSSGRP